MKFKVKDFKDILRNDFGIVLRLLVGSELKEGEMVEELVEVLCLFG